MGLSIRLVGGQRFLRLLDLLIRLWTRRVHINSSNILLHLFILITFKVIRHSFRHMVLQWSNALPLFHLQLHRYQLQHPCHIHSTRFIHNSSILIFYNNSSFRRATTSPRAHSGPPRQWPQKRNWRPSGNVRNSSPLQMERSNWPEKRPSRSWRVKKGRKRWKM